MSVLYVLSAKATSVVARVSLNGLPAVQTAGSSMRAGAKVNPWLLPGGNRVTVAVAGPSEAGEDPPALRVRLQQGTQGADPGTSGILFEYEWQPGLVPLLPGVFADAAAREFDVGALPWTLPWHSAQPQAPDATAIATVLSNILGALNARAFARAADLLAGRFETMGLSLDLAPGELRQDFEDGMTEAAVAADWAWTAAGSPQLVPAADGRLVQVVDEAGGPPLRGVAGGESLAMTVVLSHLDGTWRVVG